MAICVMPLRLETGPCPLASSNFNGSIIGFVIKSAREPLERGTKARRTVSSSEGGRERQPIGCIRALCHLLSSPTAHRRVADKRFQRCLKLRRRRPLPLTPAAGFLAVTRSAVPSGIRPPFGWRSTTPPSWILLAARTARRRRARFLWV